MPALINGSGSVGMLLAVALITFSLEANPPRLLTESDIDAVLKSKNSKGAEGVKHLASVLRLLLCCIRILGRTHWEVILALALFILRCLNFAAISIECECYQLEEQSLLSEHRLVILKHPMQLTATVVLSRSGEKLSEW